MTIAYHRISPFFLCIFLFQHCIKPQDFPIEPEIRFESISKSVMKQKSLGEDSISITFSFQDGDGDLSSLNGEPNIFIRDSRDNFEKSSYQIPYIEEQGANNGIAGTITILLPNTCCLYIGSSQDTIACQYVPIFYDTLSYLIFIIDRGGHESNQIETPPIRLICK